MSDPGFDDAVATFSRRDALKGSTWAALGGLAAAAGGLEAAAAAERFSFHGSHQAGVATRVQRHLAFATFDVSATERGALEALLVEWTAAAALFVEGRPLPRAPGPSYPPGDTGEALNLPAAGLTLTFGFGPSLFDARFGLESARPAALIELPKFPGDNLDPFRTGGDLCVQACADDPLVAFHAVRNLARVGEGVVALRNVQFGTGQTSTSSRSTATPRNLLGFKDGTNNVAATSKSQMRAHVWVGSESDRAWMHGGTYLVARRIRTHLEAWSSLGLTSQEAVIGRFRDTGAPLSGHREHDHPDFGAYDTFGAPTIPASAHVRVAAPRFNGGAQILRRGYNFTDGVDPTTGELDAGLMFICFQKDPRTQFVTLQTNLAANDALSRYSEHTGSGVFACPPGAPRGRSIGHSLFSS